MTFNSGNFKTVVEKVKAYLIEVRLSRFRKFTNFWRMTVKILEDVSREVTNVNGDAQVFYDWLQEMWLWLCNATRRSKEIAALHCPPEHLS
jgi:uncharacterized protein CbrC (UPF0167 family)